LTIGADVSGAVTLRANSNISNRGFELGGDGFIVTEDQAAELGRGRLPGLEAIIRPYRNGRDLMNKPRKVLCIDLFGFSKAEVRETYPEVFQWVFNRVRPKRLVNRDKKLRENWWLHRRLRVDLRGMLDGLPRFIATVETAKHRVFQFLDASFLPDNKLIAIAEEDAYFLGILSSKLHVCWALAAGGSLGVGNDPVYIKTRCFEAFPFPDASDDQTRKIREIAEQLDVHRKTQLEAHDKLTLTDMYNVLEKLRSGEQFDEKGKDKQIHEWGLVTVLKEIHDQLDEAVFEAYGWSPNLTDEEILERLVALNHERAAEEAQGKIRWLRPEFQNPKGDEGQEQGELAVDTSAKTPTKKAAAPANKSSWPKELPQKLQALQEALLSQDAPLTAEDLARMFVRAQAPYVEKLLEALEAVGQVRKLPDGRYSAE